jgi:hypothetical protein
LTAAGSGIPQCAVIGWPGHNICSPGREVDPTGRSRAHPDRPNQGCRMNRTANEVQEMKDKGAVGTDEDFEHVIDYLARSFPPR